MSMLVRMAAMALTWSDLERSKLRTRIFQRAVIWKRLQIGPWLPLKLNRKSLMLFQRAPVAVTWSDLVIAAIVVKLGSKFAHFSRYLNETWWAQWSYA